MENINLEQIPFNKTIKTLKKRRNHLRERIEVSDKDLSFDKQEKRALEYAIAVLCALKNCKFFCGTLERSRSQLDEEDTLQN